MARVDEAAKLPLLFVKSVFMCEATSVYACEAGSAPPPYRHYTHLSLQDVGDSPHTRLHVVERKQDGGW
jgi:hypothetical protein